jgi:hypothetical protein
MLEYRCHYCGAEPDEWCRTKSGFRSGSLHSSRWYQWKADGGELLEP